MVCTLTNFLDSIDNSTKSKFFLILIAVLIGVVLAAEKKEASKLFIPTKESGKLYKMDEHILVSVSGVVADANFLIDYGRLQC